MHLKKSILPLAITLAFSATAVAEKSYIAWGRVYDVTQNFTQRGVAVATDPQGNVAVTGFLDNSGDGTFYTAKYDGGTGGLLWQKTYNSPNGDDRTTAIATDSGGNVIVTGYSVNGNGRDYYTIKYGATTGNVVWEKRYNNAPTDGEDEPVAIVVDGSDNVIVTGRSVGTGTNYDIHTIKYSSGAGGILWEKRYNSVGNFEDSPKDLAVDSLGNVAVTGLSRVGGNQCFVTVRYNGSTGAQLWAKTYDGSANKDDVAFGVATDSLGNVLVVGSERDSSGYINFTTIKYSAAAGNVVWDTTYDTPEATTDPNGIAVDKDDNVVISGSSRLDNFKTTFYTAKYSGANGGVIWEKRSPADGGNDDNVKAFALDGSGNVIVTGTSEDSGQTTDYYTVKYSAVDGSVLWEEFLNGDREGGHDTPSGIAVDGNGDVAVVGTARKAAPSPYFEMLTVKYNRHLLTIGDPISGPGLTNEAVVSVITQPAVADTGALTAKVTVKDGKKKYAAILLQGGGGGNIAAAMQGQAVTGVMNAKYVSFQDPVIAPNGKLAFIGKITGVPAMETTGVFGTDFVSNSTVPLIRVGKQAPGLPQGVLVKTIAAISRAEDRVIALVTLKGPGITGLNSTAIVGVNASGATGVAQTGTQVTVNNATAAIKKLSIFTPPTASKGHGRYQGLDRYVYSATLADKRTVLFRANEMGQNAPMFATGGDATQIGMDVKWKAPGLPCVGSNGFHYTAKTTLEIGKGSVTAASDTALVYSAVGATFDDYAREGGPVPGLAGAQFTLFSDPVSNGNGQVAFIGTFKGQGVAATNKTALFAGPYQNLKTIARVGFPAPDTFGVADTATFASIPSFALPTSATGGPIFLATVKGKGVTKKNNYGLWGSSSAGVARQVFRTGDFIGDQTVSKFLVLNTAVGSLSNSRSFNGARSMVALVTFTDKTQSLIRVSLP